MGNERRGNGRIALTVFFATLLFLGLSSRVGAQEQDTVVQGQNSGTTSTGSDLHPTQCVLSGDNVTCNGPIAWNDCEEGSTDPNCYAVGENCAGNMQNCVGAQSMPGNAKYPIDVHYDASGKACRFVDNTTTDVSYFVPFKSAAEWKAFVDMGDASKISGGQVVLAKCVRPDTASLNADATVSSATYCPNPVLVTASLSSEALAAGFTLLSSPSSVTVGLPYARINKSYLGNARYTCELHDPDCKDGVIQTWQQNVDGTFTTVDASVHAGVWTAGYIYTDISKPAECIPGVCGPAADGQAYSISPLFSGLALCDEGTASAISGGGGVAWTWTCYGDDDGRDVVCSAPYEEVDPCGSAAGVETPTMPTFNLCKPSYTVLVSSSNPNGDNMWEWLCVDAAGTSKTCTAPAPETGDCGSAHGRAFYMTEPPPGAYTLCDAESSAFDLGGIGPWAWQCVPKSGGGTAKNCEAQVKKDGVCNPATNGSGASSSPGSQSGETGVLCDYTRAALTSPSGTGPWDWICYGLNGGKDANCSTGEIVETGVCGAANGVASATKPSSGLCQPDGGTATAVTGPTGHTWYWDCLGQGGGGDAPCSAPEKKNGACGSVDGSEPVSKPADQGGEEGSLCAFTGTVPTTASGEATGPWSWACYGINGGSNKSCQTTAVAKDGECGDVSAHYASSPPTATCDETGVAPVLGPLTNHEWSWTCTGQHGGADTLCKVKEKIDGKCNAPPDGAKFTESSPPSGASNYLCAYTSVVPTLSGPIGGKWTWTCKGLNGGNDDFGEAFVDSSEDGVCKAVAATPSAPEGTLCTSSGGQSAVSGPTADYKWTWTCYGKDGGDDTSCFSLELKNGDCGDAVNSSYSTQPTVNLCDYTSGTPNPQGGEATGQWVWSCEGLNGGSNVSCVAPYAVPTNVDPECGNLYTKYYVAGGEWCTNTNPESKYPYATHPNHLLWCKKGIRGSAGVTGGASTDAWKWTCESNEKVVDCVLCTGSLPSSCPSGYPTSGTALNNNQTINNPVGGVFYYNATGISVTMNDAYQNNIAVQNKINSVLVLSGNNNTVSVGGNGSYVSMYGNGNRFMETIQSGGGIKHFFHGVNNRICIYAPNQETIEVEGLYNVIEIVNSSSDSVTYKLKGDGRLFLGSSAAANPHMSTSHIINSGSWTIECPNCVIE